MLRTPSTPRPRLLPAGSFLHVQDLDRVRCGRGREVQGRRDATDARCVQRTPWLRGNSDRLWCALVNAIIVDAFANMGDQVECGGQART